MQGALFLARFLACHLVKASHGEVPGYEADSRSTPNQKKIESFH